MRVVELNIRHSKHLFTVRYTPLLHPSTVASFNATFFMGNAYNFSTYKDIPLPKVFFVPNTCYEHLYNSNIPAKVKNHKTFVFTGGSRQVHKGLDLLLEIFPRHPGYGLHICRYLEGEPDFCKVYQKELYFTPNISTQGFINIESKEFLDLYAQCAFLLLPSCSEGQAGSVLAGISEGVIPIVSKEAGYSEDDGVIELRDCIISTIKSAILTTSRYGKILSTKN